MSERLSQKQIKQDIREDEVQSFLITAIERFQARPGFYFGILGSILALGVLVTVVVAQRKKGADEAANELAKAIRIYEAPVVESDAKPDDLTSPSFASEADRQARVEQALAEIKSGPAGDIAGLYKAQLALDSGDAAPARKIWEDFLNENGDQALGLSVRLNLIHLDREEGKLDEVASRLQQQLDGTGETLPEDVLIYELAKTREALGERETAKDLYQRLLDEYPQSSYAAAARRETAS